MDLINKWWKRILVSLFIGGAFAEGLSVLTNNKLYVNAFIIGIILYLILSVTYGIIQKDKNV